MKNTINTTEELKNKFNLEINKNEQKYLDYFFSKKSIQFKNNKIIYPKLENINQEINELTEKISKLKENEKYWNKKKKDSENYLSKIHLKMIFNKNYWKHKIKIITNPEYKQDVIDTNLKDDVLMDPEYKHMFNSFLVDPDYRKKLKETINNSIIYKNTKIGDYSAKKQKFKQEAAKKRIEQHRAQINKLEFKLKTNKQILKIIKKYM